MAVNKPIGDNARKGAVKKRSQLKNKLAGSWTKRAKESGEFMAVKKTKEKFKGVRKERAAAATKSKRDVKKKKTTKKRG